jgi:hypothetical protein
LFLLGNAGGGGMVLGFAMGSLPGTHAAAPASRDPNDPILEVVSQLKDLKTQVKEINTLLHDGNVKVAILMNPELGK